MRSPAPRVAVFGSSSAVRGSPEWDAGHDCGRLLAEAGVTVVTGGYGGTMEAVSAGAAGAGGHVVGVIAPAVFPRRVGANPHVVEVVESDSLTLRIHRLLHGAAGVIVLPGSLGTFTELIVAWNAAYVAPLSGRAPLPIVAVGPTWQGTVRAIATQLDAPAELIHLVDTVEDAVAQLVAALD